MKKIPPIVCVIWEDACNHSQWDDRADAEKKTAEEVLSIGFLVKENEKKIVLALDMSRNADGLEQFNCYAVVPKGCITKRRTIKAPLNFSRVKR